MKLLTVLSQDVDQVNRQQIYLQLILETLPIILFTTDRQGVITTVEGQGLRRIGLTAQELVGQSVSQVCKSFFPQDADRIIEHIHQVLAGTSVCTIGNAGSTVYEIVCRSFCKSAKR